jgi:uncharacterized YigZ family protein
MSSAIINRLTPELLMNTFFTIEKPSLAEYKDRGSRFLAYAYPIKTTEEFKKQLKALKEEHPKAAHHCFAYRLGTDNLNFRSGDDGEPSGSAGKPILNQIDSKNLTDTAVIVVRYFGGTLLGVPGLINAYKTATSFALQLTPIVEKPILAIYTLEFDYTLMNEVMMILKKNNCEILNNEMQLFCRIKAGIPKVADETVIQKLRELYGLQIMKTE